MVLSNYKKKTAGKTIHFNRCSHLVKVKFVQYFFPESWIGFPFIIKKYDTISILHCVRRKRSKYATKTFDFVRTGKHITWKHMMGGIPLADNSVPEVIVKTFPSLFWCLTKMLIYTKKIQLKLIQGKNTRFLHLNIIAYWVYKNNRLQTFKMAIVIMRKFGLHNGVIKRCIPNVQKFS